MKKTIFLFLFVVLTTGLFAQTARIETSGTTSKPVEGTEFKNGRIVIKAGYEAKLSEDKKTVTIYLLTGNGTTTTGQYSCLCMFVNGDCFPQLNSDSFSCASSNEKPCMQSCDIIKQNTGTIPGKPVNQKTWKKLVVNH